MIIHEINDLSNNYVINLLKTGLSHTVDDISVENYHPDYSNKPGNLFYILNQGRYRVGHGKYFVIENNGEYITSAGWNRYELEEGIALVLSRAHTNRNYRNDFYLGKYLLPKCIEETTNYKKVWITVNEHNKTLYNWVDRYHKTKNLLGWPEIYGNFRTAGKHDIYYTTQYVVELIKETQ
jgi:hypothetical protein